LDAELTRPEMRHLHPMGRGIWSYLTENIYLKIPPAHQQVISDGYEYFQRPFTKALHDNGVKLMTGTDALIPTNIPGFSIHDELLELVEIGLTPFEALKASTTHPMDYLGELDDGGTIEVGKRADLVLLGANPLNKITNARKIFGVMCREIWFNRDDILSRLA
jgi:imidazolonepropionase-like amidohydrolase